LAWVAELGHEMVVQTLLDQGVNVNAQGRHYSNALEVVSVRGYVKVVQILLDQGANVNAQGGNLWQRTTGGISRRSREGGADTVGPGRRCKRPSWILWQRSAGGIRRRS
jgi:Ankyrin repeat